MKATPTIHVVDDDESFQALVSRALRAAGYTVRGYTTASAFLLARTEERPACILLDVQLPGPSGLDLQSALITQPDPLPIVFVSARADVATSVQAMKAGAVDFLTKPVQRDALLKALQTALARAEERRLARERNRPLSARYETLTSRELEVFKGVVAGKANKQIASDLAMAERTIKAHRAQLMKKMHATSVAELVQIAIELQNPPGAQSHWPLRPAAI